MNAITAGAQIVYVLSVEDAENINQQIAKYPDRQPAGTHVAPGQRVPATAVISLGPQQAGPERLAVRLDGADPSGPEHAYHVAAADLVYADGAWHKPEN